MAGKHDEFERERLPSCEQRIADLEERLDALASLIEEIAYRVSRTYPPVNPPAAFQEIPTQKK